MNLKPKTKYYQEFSSWSLDEYDGGMQIFFIEAEGSTIDELEESAIIALETWHGEQGPTLSFGDLSPRTETAVRELFVEFLAGKGLL